MLSIRVLSGPGAVHRGRGARRGIDPRDPGWRRREPDRAASVYTESPMPFDWFGLSLGIDDPDDLVADL
jgi:hypothetical protein